MKTYGVSELVVAGGVAANQGLRKRLSALSEEENVRILIPSMKLCTDNAAMIGAAAYVVYKKGKFAQMDLNAVPRSEERRVGKEC